MIRRKITRRFTGAIALCLTVAGAALAASQTPAPTAASRVEKAAAPAALTDHVIVISIDGLRPDAIEKFDAGTLKRLMREGAYSLEARTILPSKTLPSHTSMLTGVPPEVHGISWNEDRTGQQGVVSVPTVFEVAKSHGLRTAAFFSKSKFHHLEKPGTLDHSEAPDGITHLMAAETVEAAVRYMKHEKPNLLFIHIGEPDYAGHAIGWMSFVYGWAVKRADGAVKSVLEAADDAYGRGAYTVIVTADHGGHGRNHGSADPRDMTIPWIAWGEGVKAGTQMPAGIRTMDTSATALWLLGIEEPEEWVGRPVAGAFAPATSVAAEPPTRT